MVRDRTVHPAPTRPIAFRLRRGARRRLSRVEALTIDVRVDFDLDGHKSAHVVEDAPPDPEGYRVMRLDFTRVFVRSETFTGLRLTRLPDPSRITLAVDGEGGLVADVRFAG